MLGHALQEVFPHAQCYGHRGIDITDENALMKFLKRECPAIVINAAAYTDVDGCEDNLLCICGEWGWTRIYCTSQ